MRLQQIIFKWVMAVVFSAIAASSNKLFGTGWVNGDYRIKISFSRAHFNGHRKTLQNLIHTVAYAVGISTSFILQGCRWLVTALYMAVKLDRTDRIRVAPCVRIVVASFPANPDLPARIKTGAPLNQPNPAKFYTPGPEGYTDYPALSSL